MTMKMKRTHGPMREVASVVDATLEEMTPKRLVQQRSKRGVS
jgi:hypothetical protein